MLLRERIHCELTWELITQITSLNSLKMKHSFFSKKKKKSISQTLLCAISGKWCGNSPQHAEQQVTAKHKETPSEQWEKYEYTIIKFNHHHVNCDADFSETLHSHISAGNNPCPKTHPCQHGGPALAVPISWALISQHGKQQSDVRALLPPIARAIRRKTLVWTHMSLIVWAG